MFFIECNFYIFERMEIKTYIFVIIFIYLKYYNNNNSRNNINSSQVRNPFGHGPFQKTLIINKQHYKS